ncbi:MAG TPA: hypothetical protein VEG60_23045, partial [Candidatus Binatia bacterium]|nr:hypothetical protein [Candidatus Binatia bacterium]
FWAVTRMLEIFRTVQSGVPETIDVSDHRAARAWQVEPILGHYVYLNVEDTEFRVYFEEHGKGIPLILPAHRRFRRTAVAPFAER